MEAEAKRAVLIGIAKGKLHLVAVGIDARTGQDAEEVITFPRVFDQLLHLCALQLQLLRIRQRPVDAPAACTEMRTVRLHLLRCRLQDFQKPPLEAAAARLVHREAHPLSGDAVFNHDTAAVLRADNSLIGEHHGNHHAIGNLSFFHTVPPTYDQIKKKGIVSDPS